LALTGFAAFTELAAGVAGGGGAASLLEPSRELQSRDGHGIDIETPSHDIDPGIGHGQARQYDPGGRGHGRTDGQIRDRESGNIHLAFRRIAQHASVSGIDVDEARSDRKSELPCEVIRNRQRAQAGNVQYAVRCDRLHA
jgi:hypothetical protein